LLSRTLFGEKETEETERDYIPNPPPAQQRAPPDRPAHRRQKQGTEEKEVADTLLADEELRFPPNGSWTTFYFTTHNFFRAQGARFHYSTLLASHLGTILLFHISIIHGSAHLILDRHRIFI
jgi:hypothetical protein